MDMGRQLNGVFMKSSNYIKALHTVAGLNRSSGGPARTVSSLCEGLGRLGASIEIITQGSSSDENIIPQSAYVKTTFVPAISIPKFRLIYAPSFRKTLMNHCQQTEVRLIHDHGLWLPTNHSAAAAARRLNIPLIISPRGMLESWSLRYKAMKKWLAWKLYQYRDLSAAYAFHATSIQEAESIRKLGFKQPIAVIPNGIQFPMEGYVNGQTDLRTALFLSRIHPKKGLFDLVKAWQIVRPKGWRMIIAGPDENGHQKEIQAAIHQAGLEDMFQFVGSVEGEAKANLYRSADLFILPTFTENFGVVVAEALSYGVPVITTKGAPWEGLITHGCGWWIDIGAEPLAAAIREAVAISDEERYAMGKRGRLFVEKNFGWSDIAEKMLFVYQWILKEGSKPECVIHI